MDENDFDDRNEVDFHDSLLEEQIRLDEEDAKAQYRPADINEEARSEIVLKRGGYVGLSCEQLLKYERDPKWQQLRIALFCFCVIGWLSILTAAILTAYYKPGCPSRPEDLDWPEMSIIYEVNVPSFRVGSNCGVRNSGNVKGVYDIFDMPNDTSSRNYFLNTLYPVNILWLRGLHSRSSGSSTKDELSSSVVGSNGEYLSDLFSLAKKKKRFILIDLLPYELTNFPIQGKLNCSFLADVDDSYSRNLSSLINSSSLNIRCFTEAELRTRLVAFVRKHAYHVNGFVLDYSPWLVRTKPGRSVLQEIVETLRTYDEDIADSTFRNHFGKKFIFMRMPALDRFFNNTMPQRLQDELVAKLQGVRTIIETVDFIGGADCSSSGCLVDLINELQKPKPLMLDVDVVGESFNKTSVEVTDIPHRAFTIDDPLLSRRALPSQIDKEWSTESLAAFVCTALPGSPVVYFGSEIGMSHQSPRTQMRWRNDHNECDHLRDEPYCFCALFCNFKQNTPSTCPQANPKEFPLYASYKVGSETDFPPSVAEQVRSESKGPLKTVVNLMKAKRYNDALMWGAANASLFPVTSSNERPAIVVLRTANERFDDYVLIISFGSKGGNFRALHFRHKCYEEVVFHNKPKDFKSVSGSFDQMVVQTHEVRLLKVVTCSSSTRALSVVTLVLAFSLKQLAVDH